MDGRSELFIIHVFTTSSVCAFVLQVFNQKGFALVTHSCTQTLISHTHVLCRESETFQNNRGNGNGSNHLIVRTTIKCVRLQWFENKRSMQHLSSILRMGSVPFSVSVSLSLRPY